MLLYRASVIWLLHDRVIKLEEIGFSRAIYLSSARTTAHGYTTTYCTLMPIHRNLDASTTLGVPNSPGA